MSRIGKNPIDVPSGVEVKSSASTVSVKGPKGTLTLDTCGHVEVALEGTQVMVRRFDDSRRSKAYHGLYQRLITNMVKGVKEGFTKELEIQGIGYKAAMDPGGKKLNLNLGYSHPIEFPVPAGITITSPKPTQIFVAGADKQLVGQTTANIRGLRPPEPYGGKGIRHAGERVVIKEGKKSTK